VSKTVRFIWDPLKGAVLLFTALVLMVSWLTPLLLGGQASAAQLTVRSLTLSSGVPSKTGVTYSYAFTTATAGSIQSIKFVACTTAFQTYSRGGGTGTAGCTAPSGMNINQGTQQGANTFDNTTSFSRVTSTTGNCAPGNNVLCINRTQAASESAVAKTIAWNTQTNPSTANSAFYIGIYTYSDNAFATPVDSGTVASAVVQTLTVSANVAEVLQFCIGSTTVNDATSDVTGANPDDCSGVSGTSLNLGTLDSSQINVSPWSTDGGDSNNGVAMIRTNAANGATVSYDAIQASTGSNHLGTLRLSGSSCNAGTVSTDGCINAAGTTQTTFTAGQEKFGMTIAGVNCSANGGFSYTCNFATGATNLAPQANYIGDAYSQGSSGTFGTTAGFAWQENGTSVTIASSTGSTVKQIDDEALILAFAATPAITTPFGAYSVQADFTAVPTY
jgi:hypothetical protein